MKRKLGIAVLLSALAFILYKLFSSLNLKKVLTTTAPVSTGGATAITTTNVLYPAIANVPTTYVNLKSDGTTSHTIPAGTIQYAWRIVSGTAVVNGTTYDNGIFEDQPYEPGVTYAAITIASVTGQVIITYKKPVVL